MVNFFYIIFSNFKERKAMKEQYLEYMLENLRITIQQAANGNFFSKLPGLYIEDHSCEGVVEQIKSVIKIQLNNKELHEIDIFFYNLNQT